MKARPNHRLLIDLERLRYPYSGLGYYCRALARGLMEQEVEDMEYHFYAPRSTEVPRRKVFSPLHAYLNPSPRGFDLVHLTHQRQHYFPQSWGTRQLVTLHDLNYLTEPLSLSKRERLHRLVSSNLSRAQGIVCISDFVRMDLERHRELFDLPEELPIWVVHNGIFLPDETSLATQPRTELIPEAPYLLSIGVLHEKKQQHLLLPMLAYLPEELHLVLVYSEAKGAYLDRVNVLITRHQLQHRVHLLRAITEPEKNLLLYHATALVHPSIAEGFGLPIVEAMALGKPLFLRPETSLPEVGGEDAFYFEDVVPEAMATLVEQGLELSYRQPERRDRLRERAKLFDYRTMAQGYQAVYHQLLPSCH